MGQPYYAIPYPVVWYGGRMSITASRTKFFEAGLTTLAEFGPDRLTIAVLCDALTVTKGSFYHHFKSIDAYFGGLIEYWELEYTDEVVRLSKRGGDAVDRLAVLEHLVSAYPHAAERSIRGWATANPAVAAVVARVDRRRIEYVASVINAAIHDTDRAMLLARIAVSVLIGAQQIDPIASSDELFAMFVELQAVVEGVANPKQAAAAHDRRRDAP